MPKSPSRFFPKPERSKRLLESLGFAPGWGEGAFLELGQGDPRTLEAGMVFHMPPALRVYAELGVGCSETVLVTPSGVDVLTNFPRELAQR